MGNICCKIQEPDSIINNSLSNHSKENTIDLSMQFNLIDTLGKKYIDGNLKEMLKEQDNEEIKNKDNHIANTNLLTFNNKLDVWVKFTSMENTTNLLHNYYIEMDIPFTPELIQMFYLNVSEEVFKEYNKKAASFQVTHTSISKDTIVYIIKTSTKKILLVQPKQFYIVRVVRRMNDGSMMEFSQSVKSTNLKEIKEFANCIKNFNNEGDVKFSGIHTIKNDKGSNHKIFNKIDALSGISLRILKSFIKKSIIRSNNEFMVKLAEFTLNTTENEKLVWFSDDKEDIKRILDENKELLEKNNFKVDSLNKEAQINYQLSQTSLSTLSMPSNIQMKDFILSNLPEDRKGTKELFSLKMNDMILKLQERIKEMKGKSDDKIKEDNDLDIISGEIDKEKSVIEVSCLETIDEQIKSESLENILNSHLLLFYSKFNDKLDILNQAFSLSVKDKSVSPKNKDNPDKEKEEPITEETVIKETKKEEETVIKETKEENTNSQDE